jgi:putative phosphoesterase
VVTLGILSDTHVPDRVRSLQPPVISIFREAQVDAILHAGDICSKSVLEQLQEIAPVHAVRGNRDWFQLRHLPATLTLNFEGVTVGLIHGHGSFEVYLLDKIRTLAEGTRPERYLQRAFSALPEARVVIYGHTHIPTKRWIDGRLCFNPGSAACPDDKAPAPSVGLLRIQPGGVVSAEIVYFTFSNS